MKLVTQTEVLSDRFGDEKAVRIIRQAINIVIEEITRFEVLKNNRLFFNRLFNVTNLVTVFCCCFKV